MGGIGDKTCWTKPLDGMLPPAMGIVKKKANGDWHKKGKGVGDLLFSNS